MRRFATPLCLTVCALLYSAGATAGTVYLPFHGQLDDAFGSLVVGTTFSGSITYEHPQTRVSGRFLLGNLSLNIGPASFSLDGGAIYVYDTSTGYPTDLFYSISSPPAGTMLGGLELTSIDFVLQDITGRVFADNDLPSSLDINAFSHDPGPGNPSFLQLGGRGPSPRDQNFNSRGRLAAVPEPSTWLMLAAFGLPTLIAAIRRR